MERWDAVVEKGSDSSASAGEKWVGGNQAKWLFMKRENGEVTACVT